MAAETMGEWVANERRLALTLDGTGFGTNYIIGLITQRIAYKSDAVH